MIFIVTEVFVSRSCPVSLRPVVFEMRKAAGNAFESEEHLSRYVKGLTAWVNDLCARAHGRMSGISVCRSCSGNTGAVSVIRHDRNAGDLLRLSYIVLRGHVSVGRDGRTVYPQHFIEEGGIYDGV